MYFQIHTEWEWRKELTADLGVQSAVLECAHSFSGNADLHTNRRHTHHLPEDLAFPTHLLFEIAV